jgi:hypothetical protein
MAEKLIMHMIMMILLVGYLINNHIQVIVTIHQQSHRHHHHGFRHQLISQDKTSFNLSLYRIYLCVSVCVYLLCVVNWLRFLFGLFCILFYSKSYPFFSHVCLLIIRMNKKKKNSRRL